MRSEQETKKEQRCSCLTLYEPASSDRDSSSTGERKHTEDDGEWHLCKCGRIGRMQQHWLVYDSVQSPLHLTTHASSHAVSHVASVCGSVTARRRQSWVRRPGSRWPGVTVYQAETRVCSSVWLLFWIVRGNCAVMYGCYGKLMNFDNVHKKV